MPALLNSSNALCRKKFWNLVISPLWMLLSTEIFSTVDQVYSPQRIELSFKYIFGANLKSSL